jgi:hypothetical protein
MAVFQQSGMTWAANAPSFRRSVGNYRSQSIATMPSNNFRAKLSVKVLAAVSLMAADGRIPQSGMTWAANAPPFRWSVGNYLTQSIATTPSNNFRAKLAVKVLAAVSWWRNNRQPTALFHRIV